MPSFGLTSVNSKFSKITLKRGKIGSVWQVADSDDWKGALTFKGQKLSAVSDSRRETFHLLVAQANRIVLGCAPDDEAGAIEALNLRNRRIEKAAQEINASAGKTVAIVRSSGVSI